MTDDQLIKLPPAKPRPKKKVKLDTLLKSDKLPDRSKRSWLGKFGKSLRASKKKSPKLLKLKKSKRSKGKVKAKRLSKYNFVFVAMAIMGLGLLIFVKPHPTSEDNPKTLSAEATNDSQVLSEDTQPDDEGTPEGFKTIVPDIASSTGITKTYDAEKGIMIFQDTLEGNPIKITEQKLPKELKTDNSAVKNLALSILGKMMITQLVADFGPVYLVDLQNGSQNVVFAMGDMLVFITSDQQIAVNTWLEYLNSMQ